MFIYTEKQDDYVHLSDMQISTFSIHLTDWCNLHIPWMRIISFSIDWSSDQVTKPVRLLVSPSKYGMYKYTVC